MEKSKCEICGKEFDYINRSHLRMHGITHTEYLKLYPDSKCRFAWSEGFTKKNNDVLKLLSKKVTNTLKQKYKTGDIVVWNKGLGGTGRCKAWNKDLTKETSSAVRKNVEKTGETLKRLHATGKIKIWSDGLTKNSNDTLKRMSEDRMGDNNVAKRPEVREQIRQTLLATYESHPEILENRKSSGINQHSTGYTSIEVIVKTFLEDNQIPFTHNEKVGRYHIDFIIGNIVIECDGDYWHNKPGAQINDEKKTKYLQDNGFTVLRFTETELINNFDKCQHKILWELHQRQNNLV